MNCSGTTIWYQRFQEEEEGALVDRSSRPHGSPHATGLDLTARAVSLRRNQRLSYVQIAERLGLSRATVGRICQRHGVAHLPSLGEAPPKRHHERKTPGELLHLDTKKLARFARPGRRVTSNRGQHTSKAGYHGLHVAIDDHSRVDFSPIRADETAHNVVHFTLAALRYYQSLGIQVTRIMTDNGAAYRSCAYARLLRRLGIRHIFTGHTRSGPMGRRNALSRPICGNEPMPKPTQIPMRAPKNCRIGFTITIFTDLTPQPSICHPSQDSALLGTTW